MWSKDQLCCLLEISVGVEWRSVFMWGRDQPWCGDQYLCGVEISLGVMWR